MSASLSRTPLDVTACSSASSAWHVRHRADVPVGGRLFVGAERAVGVASQLFNRQALVARRQRRSQDFIFHRFTAAVSFRLALTMYALAPLVLVKPSAAVIASSRIS